MSEVVSSWLPPDRNTRRYALLGALFGLIFPLVATGVQLIASGAPFTVANMVSVQAQPIMWVVDLAPIILAAFAAFAGRRQDLLEANAALLEEQARRLQGGQQALESRVAERTGELEQRDRQMLSAVQITRRLTQIHNFAELASTAVRMIAETVPNFIVDLYTVEPRTSAVVRAASSEGEQIPEIVTRVGERDLVGQVAASGMPDRTEVPGTGQAMAVPLLAHGRLTGVLHLRARSAEAVLPAETAVVELLADQLAAAIEASRLYGEARATLQQLQALSGQAAQSDMRAWQGASGEALEYTRTGIRNVQPGVDYADPRSLIIPIELRGQRIGKISILRAAGPDWTDADRDLAAKSASQVALALENARLLEETRARAMQERSLSEFSARLGQSVDLDSLLQTAVRELAAMPDVAEASIFLNPEAADSMQGST